MFATKFQNIRIHENKKISSFYYELIDVVNCSFNLGEPISNSKVVRKILRSLPEIFKPKITTIEESKDIDSKELMNLLASYRHMR